MGVSDVSQNQGGENRYDWAEDPTAQDVIDAMRFAVTAQDDPGRAFRILRGLLEYAPDTEGSRGIELLLRLVSEGMFSFELVDHAR